MKSKIRELELAAIKETFVVRIALDSDRVNYLKSLKDSGIELDPVLVSEEEDGSFELIDGRHRKAAYQLSGSTTIRCQVKKYDSLTEKIVVALKCNVHGPLPPKEADLSHVMQLLLAAGESRRSIIEMISFQVGFPPRLIKKHLDWVQANLQKSLLRKAHNTVVNDGKTVHEAAAEYGISVETLKKHLQEKNGDEEGAINFNQLQSHIRQNCNRLNHVLGSNLSRIARDLKDGVINEREAMTMIAYVEQLVENFNRRHREWVKRFDVHTSTVQQAQKKERKRAQKAQDIGKKALVKMGLDKEVE